MDYKFLLFALAFALIPLIPAVIIELLNKEKERLTPEDVDTIFKLVLKYRKEWADQKGCYPEVIEEFYKTKRK